MLTFSQSYRFKQGLWRKATPKGMKLKRFVEGPDGALVHDTSFVGESAWEDDADKAQESIKEIIQHDPRLNTEDKKSLQEDLGLSGSFLIISFSFMQDWILFMMLYSRFWYMYIIIWPAEQLLPFQFKTKK